MVRVEVIDALQKIKDVGAMEPLIAAVADEHETVRLFAVSAITDLGEIEAKDGKSRAVEALIAAPTGP